MKIARVAEMLQQAFPARMAVTLADASTYCMFFDKSRLPRHGRRVV